MFPAASGPYAEPGILCVPQRNFCRATRRMPGSVGLHQWEPDPHGRRRAEQDQVSAGLGQCGPDESQMPQVRPGLLPLLRGHIGPRGDAGESRAGEQAGRPGHDWIGGERQWQRWGRAGCVGGVGSFERGGAHAHQSGAIGGRRWSTSLALWRGHAQGDLWHPANRCVRGYFLAAGDIPRVRGQESCPRRRRTSPAVKGGVRAGCGRAGLSLPGPRRPPAWPPPGPAPDGRRP